LLPVLIGERTCPSPGLFRREELPAIDLRIGLNQRLSQGNPFVLIKNCFADRLIALANSPERTSSSTVCRRSSGRVSMVAAF